MNGKLSAEELIKYRSKNNFGTTSARFETSPTFRPTKSGSYFFIVPKGQFCSQKFFYHENLKPSPNHPFHPLRRRAVQRPRPHSLDGTLPVRGSGLWLCGFWEIQQIWLWLGMAVCAVWLAFTTHDFID
jgi:hypothetical protein